MSHTISPKSLNFPLVSRLALAVALGAALAPSVAWAKHVRRAPVAAADGTPRWTARPKGAVIIVVSLADERLTLYDDGVAVARTPVSTGVAGHETPRGIFTVIQKDRYHKSNIYSDAPMPFMQRITWSGIALHEGHVTGHPASHGCIRMPAAFAARLWPYTQMGVRVIVSNFDPKPEDISNANLFAAAPRPATAEAAPAKRLRFAQAEGASATDAGAAPAPASANAAKVEQAIHPGFVVETISAAEAFSRLADAERAGAVAAAIAASVAPVVAPAPAAPAIAAETPAVEEASAPSPVVVAVAPPAAPAIAAEPTAPSPEAAPEVASLPPADVVPAAPAIAPIDIPAGTGHVAIFVSKRLGKLFVRRDFKPIFEAPVVIRDPAAPLGSHLYTAMDVSSDGANVRWTALDTRDTPPPQPIRRPRKGEAAPAPMVEPAPATSAEALDRVIVADDVRTALASLVQPGTSLIISDQGMGRETTAKGTDFIVLTR